MKKDIDIFISYSRKDTEKVTTLVSSLKTLGYSIWMDMQGVHAGEAFKSKIVAAIEKCQMVLFFSSKNSNSSKWTAQEIAIAADEGLEIIPIRLDDCEYMKSVKFDLINCNYIDYFSPKNISEVKAKLKVRLEEILGKRNNVEINSDVNLTLVALAEKYRKGDGVDIDYRFACQLYQKAADQGNSTALCNLGSMYYHGFGTSKNLRTSFVLYKLAAESGSALAMFKLGEFYFEGILGETNYNKAILLFQESAAKGCLQAKEKLNQLRLKK